MFVVKNKRKGEKVRVITCSSRRAMRPCPAPAAMCRAERPCKEAARSFAKGSSA